MTSTRISNKSVSALICPPGKDRVFLWDSALTGFGAVAFPGGRRTYVIQYRQYGRSRRMTLGEHGRLTPDEARSLAKRLLGAVEAGSDPIEQRKASARQRAFRDVAEDFMSEHVAMKRKARTKAEYRSLLDRHILPALGSRRMADLRKVDVVRLHSKLSQEGVLTTANRCLAVISSLWNWAAKQDETAGSNPAAGIERNREQGRERYLSTEELARLGEALRRAETVGLPWNVDETNPTAKHTPKGERLTKTDPYAIAAIRLLLLTGARLREILTAQWDYVDWERGLLLLPDSKTGKKTVYLSATALAVLKTVPRIQGNPFMIPGQGPRKRKGEAAPRHDLKKPWAAITRVADLEGLRIHDLRHSYAATGAGASLGLPMIGKLLGHSQPATTARYAHLDADPMKRAADLIGKRIAEVMEKKTSQPNPSDQQDSELVD